MLIRPKEVRDYAVITEITREAFRVFLFEMLTKFCLSKLCEQGGQACPRRLLEDQFSFSYIDFIKYYSQYQVELR